MTWRGTPGPWKVRQTPTGYKVGPGMRVLAKVSGVGSVPLADANGMAAVPQLVEALANLVPMARAAGVSPTYCDDAEAALKAAGVTP